MASNTANSSSAVDNSSGNMAARIALQLFTGTAPVAGTRAEIYLLERNIHAAPTVNVDNWTGTAATGIQATLFNSKLLDVVRFGASGNAAFSVMIDTLEILRRPLSPSWGIAVYNRIGQAFNATPANFVAAYSYYNPNFQL
jgi:hypothetical protein